MIPDSDIGPVNTQLTLFSTLSVLFKVTFSFFRRFTSLMVLLKILAYFLIDGRGYSPLSFYFLIASFLVMFCLFVSHRVIKLYEIKKLEAYWDKTDIQVLKNNSEKRGFDNTKIGSLRIGDIVLMRSNSTCPADILILDTSEQRHSDKVAFVNECRITGKRRVTVKVAIKNMNLIKRKSKGPLEGLSKMLKRLKGKIEYDPPSPSDSFLGKFNLTNDPKMYQITNDNVIFCGSRLHTTWVIGYVLYNGTNTKIV